MSGPPYMYLIIEVPDAVDPSLRSKAGGDVATAMQADIEHALRTPAALPPESAAIAIRFLYQPNADGRDLQQRLSIYIIAEARQEETEDVLRLLVERGPLTGFYDLRPVDPVAMPVERFRATCDVVRRQSVFEATVGPEFNAKALPLYWWMRSFEPRDDNDYMRLDSVLDGLPGPALIEICVEPADVAEARAEHIRYLGRLEQVNRSWGPDDEEAFHDYRAGRTGEWGPTLKALKEEEPLVSPVRRSVERFHQTLAEPHLRFHIRVFAPTVAVARLLASVVADSAFKNGSYQLVDSLPGDALFDQAVKAHEALRVIPVPAPERFLGDRRITLFDGLSCLANLAPVDELTSVFRLPLASYGSPRCIRKHTDPPNEDPADLILLGQDAYLTSSGPARED